MLTKVQFFFTHELKICNCNKFATIGDLLPCFHVIIFYVRPCFYFLCLHSEAALWLLIGSASSKHFLYVCFWHVIGQLGIVKFDKISKLETSNITCLGYVHWKKNQNKYYLIFWKFVSSSNSFSILWYDIS